MAEYLSEEEQLAQLRSWWSRYGWWLVAAVVLGLGGYFLMQYLEKSQATTNAAASEVFERYQENPADEARAKPLLARLDGEFAGTAYQLMALMTRAQLATEAGDIDAAIGFYQKAAAMPDVEHFTDVARLRLARALQQQGRSDEAIQALGQVAGEGYRSLVAELKGDILRAQGKPAEARAAYAAAVEALGDDTRPLLSMKLADLSRPEGAAAPEDPPVLPEETEEAEETEETVADTGNESVDSSVEDSVEEGSEAIQATLDTELQSN